MIQPHFLVEEVTDPKEIARTQAQDAQFRRNLEWLEAHWADLLPGAVGKFLAVAGQEAFLGDTPQEALDRARAAHPEDTGRFIQYLNPAKGPRIYGSRGSLASRL